MIILLVILAILILLAILWPKLAKGIIIFVVGANVLFFAFAILYGLTR